MRTMGGIGGVGHIVLSDGLAAISVFIEPATGKQPGRSRVWCDRERFNVIHAPDRQLLDYGSRRSACRERKIHRQRVEYRQ